MAQQGSWAELLGGGNGLRVAVFAGGIAITAIEVYIGSTLLPSVVADIGGLDLFAWVTTIFIVASIAASIFAAVRPFGLGPRHNYLIAAFTFGLGSLVCGLAPSMEVLLLGRAIQGFGAGLLGALAFIMVRLVFPEHLWPRAFALASSMWGISTLVGPTIGGVFAELGIWRWAFFILVPATVLLAFGAVAVVPKRSSESGMTSVPLPQIVLIIVAVLCLSIASAATQNLTLAGGLVALALVAVAGVAFIERRATQRLFPSGTFVFGTTLAALFGLMLVLQMSIVSDVFVPLFLQTLHGVGPLVAGYMVALLAVGWSTASMTTAGWAGAWPRRLIGAGPVLVLLGLVGLAVFVGRSNPANEWLVLVPVGLSLLAMGVGMGICWPHLTPRVMRAAPDGEHDVTSAALNTVQLFATGMAAALAGLVVNLAGIGDPARTASAAFWLYGLWLVLPLIAIVIVFGIVRREPGETKLAQPAE